LIINNQDITIKRIVAVFDRIFLACIGSVIQSIVQYSDCHILIISIRS